MYNRITVIPDDKLIIVDEAAQVFSTAYAADPNIHAIQWKDGKGDIEYKELIEIDGRSIKNEYFTDYDVVRPYAELFDAEKLRQQVLEAERVQWEAENTQYGNSHDYNAEDKEWVENIDKLKHWKCRQVDLLRDTYIAGGVEHTFPGGAVAKIQTRNEKDIRNILTNGLKALSLVSAGTPEAPMVFRTEDDVVRELTAMQMLEMCSYAGGVGQYYYDISWMHKDVINGKKEHEGALLTTFQEIMDYDHERGWED